ncbi:hypothetical protein [Rhizobium sp. NFR07]|uniref:hypothetical protein n=1 Tax=Rhizobium sp. NFR07 TaxID=1566262 RepID=UPI0011608535|nr:hypothetical protein [Rhizobium sp. NFR07]
MSFQAFSRRKSTVGIRMARSNSLYLIIGALIVVIAGFSIYAYREETKPEGVSISIGQDGVKVQEE